ncbi:MAG: ATP-binding protein [Gemmatimonadales bacterium]
MTSPLRLVVRRTPDIPVEVSVRIPGDLEVVQEAAELLTRHCTAGLTSSPITKKLQYRLKTLLCEALANAIRHGLHEDPARAVAVRVELTAELVQIHVTDDGQGFDPTTIVPPLEPDIIDRESGRGIYIIRQLADEVSFNLQGNSICMTLRRQ